MLPSDTPERPRAVAIVGARLATMKGMRAARDVARELGRKGVIVISGGALGIDANAHIGALDGGGRTVVVVGTGVDVVYPSQHRALFDQVVAAGGAIVSQFPLGASAKHWSFPVRNATIAALADVCVVVEAGPSSGSLYTADHARALGRPVIARLGSGGCDRLVAEGAQPARTSDDILALLDGRDAAPAPPPSDPLAARLLDALEQEPRDLNEVAARAGLDAATAMALAIDLEIGGFAVRAVGGRYARVTGSVTR